MTDIAVDISVESWSILDRYVGRQSVDSRLTVGRQLADSWPTVGRQLADSRSIVGR